MDKMCANCYAKKPSSMDSRYKVFCNRHETRAKLYNYCREWKLADGIKSWGCGTK